MSGKIVLCSWIKRVNIIKIGSSQVIFVNLIDPSKTTGQPPLGRLQLLRATSPLPGSPYPVSAQVEELAYKWYICRHYKWRSMNYYTAKSTIRLQWIIAFFQEVPPCFKKTCIFSTFEGKLFHLSWYCRCGFKEFGQWKCCLKFKKKSKSNMWSLFFKFSF